MQREQVQRLLAVCASNCAATYLLDGEGMDPQNALRHAEAAELFDKSYIKGYYRQARAHEILGNIDKAVAVLERARACPDIADKSGLEAQLGELQEKKVSKE
ncbi:hypothetical protein BV25DRAFT_1922832 [Artomyces pyxidatus]|uniref:Uncharacterized protein n=1 Tax=Artomyces pyxidatus TaxID=48021 RepID=A0ACB8SEC7_9AGAM|nr:hypothetical protein BV25DRAFT_1922832 [Artomyces pyxidatus]